MSLWNVFEHIQRPHGVTTSPMRAIASRCQWGCEAGAHVGKHAVQQDGGGAVVSVVSRADRSSSSSRVTWVLCSLAQLSCHGRVMTSQHSHTRTHTRTQASPFAYSRSGEHLRDRLSHFHHNYGVGQGVVRSPVVSLRDVPGACGCA